MSIPLPKKAMVLAAGKGTRMRPLTDTIPKALVDVDGTTLIDHALDHLNDAGVEQAIINHHYRGQQMLDHLANRQGGPALSFSDETDTLLETGGGVVKALRFFDGQPFFTLNSDVIWTDENDLALHRLANSFDPETMDALLLLSPREQAIGHPGAGDFFIDRAVAGASELGPLIWRGEADTAPYIYASIHISHQALYRDPPEGAFRLTDLWQRASKEGRLFGLVHHGKWHDVGNPDGRDQAEQMLRDLRA